MAASSRIRQRIRGHWWLSPWQPVRGDSPEPVFIPRPRSAEGRLQGKNPAPYRGGESTKGETAYDRSGESTMGGKPANDRSGELVVEERIRRCIGLLMAERYGNEPLFNLQGHWQAVYRILVDKGYCRDSDFDGFDAFIRRVMPEEVNKPYKKDSVRNINKTSFNKPFDRWRYDPDDYGTRKPFERMVAIARRFKEILEEIDL